MEPEQKKLYKAGLQEYLAERIVPSCARGERGGVRLHYQANPVELTAFLAVKAQIQMYGRSTFYRAGVRRRPLLQRPG